MHYIFATRGIKKDVDEMVKFLETRALPMTIEHEGKKMVVPLQGNLQPVQLWSYVFPEESKDPVLGAICPDPDAWRYNSKMVKGSIKALRKALGLKKIPEFDKNQRMYMPDLTNIAITPIGVKYDELNWTDPKNKTIHEKL